MLAFLRDKIELMRIEVTYIDDSEPKKRLKFHLPKRRTPQPAPQPPVEQAKRAKAVKPAKLAKTTVPAKPRPSKPATQRRGLPRPVRNVLVSTIVLLVLLVGAGVAYTYFLGGDAAQTVDTVAVATKSYQSITPKTPAPDAPEGVSVSSLSSPISPGTDAFMAVQTLPGSACSISVKYGKGSVKTPSMAAGLHNTTADAYGSASWSWRVDTSAPLGTWPVTVTCEHNKHTGVVQGDMQVVAPGSATTSN